MGRPDRKERDCRDLLIQSDPHVEGAYLALGAERIGVQPSTVIPGLELALPRLLLAEGGNPPC